MITVIGSAIIDLTFNTADFPQPGETKMGTSFDQGFGGKGANQAVAAALLGSHVGFVGKVGQDALGNETIANMRSKAINATHITSTNLSHTGVASIMVAPNGENRIIVITGANNFITTLDIDAAKELLEQSEYLILQYEIPLEVVYYVLNHYHHKRIILNPAPALEAATDLQILAKAEYFIPNETEAAAITGVQITGHNSADSVFENLRILRQSGFRNIIITLGAKGAAVFFEGEEPVIVQGIKVDAKDTTGAGDAFIGSFTSFLQSGHPPREAVRKANIFAALSTLGVGTQKSYPSVEVFNDYVEEK